MYVLCSMLRHYYLYVFVIVFIVMQLYVCSLQYVVSLLFASVSYFIYSYVALFMFCAARYFTVICFCVLFYL